MLCVIVPQVLQSLRCSPHVPTAVGPADLFMLECGAPAEGAGPSGMGTSSNSSWATARIVKATAQSVKGQSRGLKMTILRSIAGRMVGKGIDVHMAIAKPNIATPVKALGSR